MASTLSGPALQASRAALSAALADQPSSIPVNDESLEPGEIQEVDMQAQAEGIRTVFSDPTNFNVKVRSTCLHVVLLHSTIYIILYSILSTLPGLSGSTLRPPRVEISRKPQFQHSHRHQSLRHLA